MPSRKKTGRSDKAARRVRLYHTMLKTPAWKSLAATCAPVPSPQDVPIRLDAIGGSEQRR
jgi:hypothetical protein